MFLVYDTETSGIPRWDLPADDPAQPRIVQIAGLLCNDDPDFDDPADRYEAIVKPEGWTIADGAAKVHGITTERALAEGKPIAEVMDAFEALAARAELVVCFNLRFDEKFRRGELRRLGRDDGFGTVPVFCCMKGATPLCKIPPTGKMQAVGINSYKTPRLEEAVRILLGREHKGAHGAMADAEATRDLYFACRDNTEFMKAGADFQTNARRAAAFPLGEPDEPTIQPGRHGDDPGASS